MPDNMDDAKGKLKEKAGGVTGNDRLRNEGKADQATGKVKDFVDSIKNRLTGKH